ncbi:hypothetical protein [Micromonospora sp. CB01531]|uniref:hypothetical protein n=1 Tax=Micromonospora sp. CB01531 TaxID=1718947 RepID=UPI00093EB499|nr:hypothetical protein [Micromonospora sp. CB01531]OKI54546.1 hypothetical protein A6A27_31975 [Micromonospora sp. CB01531]
MDDKDVSVFLDALQDKDGSVENEVRMKLELAEKAMREMFEDPDFSMGEAALAFSMALPAEHLAWYVTVLLRDRIEFGV